MIKLLEDNGGGLTMLNFGQNISTPIEAISGLEFAAKGQGIQDMYCAVNDAMCDMAGPNICYYSAVGNSHEHKEKENDEFEPYIVTVDKIWLDYLEDHNNCIRIVAEMDDRGFCKLFLGDAGSAAWKYLTGGYKPCT